jgi:hypothetical protein
MSRLTNDIYAIQFPSSTTESNEPVASVTEPPNQSSSSNNSFVNILVLNRVRLNSGRVERFGAPIGKLVFFSILLLIKSNDLSFSCSCST